MLRRHRLSHDSRNFHEHTPRKKNTYAAAPNYFNPSIYHGNHSTRTQRKRQSWLYPQQMKPKSGAGTETNDQLLPYEMLDDQQKQWIGRKIIYYGHHIPKRPEGKYITEEMIAYHASPHQYRILFTTTQNGQGYSQQSVNLPGVRSKVSFQHHPHRMNIFVDQDDIIRGIAYF